LNRWEQQRHKNANNGDHDQQFDQCKGEASCSTTDHHVDIYLQIRFVALRR
jgi:hypothetical protein